MNRPLRRLVRFAPLLIAALATGCATVTPSMKYESKVVVDATLIAPDKPLPVKVVVTLPGGILEGETPSPELDPNAAMRSFAEALRADLNTNGPYAALPEQHDAVLKVDIKQLAIFQGPVPFIGAYSILAPVIILFGGPVGSTDFVLEADATLWNLHGEKLATVTTKQTSNSYNGLWWGRDQTFEEVARRAAEDIRTKLGMQQGEVIAQIKAQAKQQQVAVATVTPREVPKVEPVPVQVKAPSLQSVLHASPQPSAYALVIGIEHYRESLPSPVGARADANRMVELLQQTFGLKPEHIRTALDDRATRSDIQKELRWLKQNVPAGSRIYFYFSGHGSPEASGSSYILPYDADPSYLEDSAVSLSSILDGLADTGAKEVVAMIDSCFSGAGGRSVLPPGARPMMKVKEVAPKANVLLLAASGAMEISGPANDGSGGLFTRYLVDGLASGAADTDGDKQISARELMGWVTPRVEREAKSQNRAQTPKLNAGTSQNADAALVWGIP